MKPNTRCYYALLIAALGLAVGGARGAPAPDVFQGHVAVTNVADYGARRNDGKDDTTAVRAAVAACQRSDTKTVYFPGGTFHLSSLAFPRAIEIALANGALLEIRDGATVTFNGTFSAGLHRVFSGNGSVQFGDGAVAEVYPQWWGAAPDLEDSSPAINQAISSAAGLPGLHVRLTGSFKCRTTIHVNRQRVTITGDGMDATRLSFDPSSAMSLFVFEMPDRSCITQCALRDLRIVAPGDYPGADRPQKTAVKVVDADVLEIRNIAIHTWGGHQSVGLHIQGRELVFVENVTILADLPILIDKCPNIDWISIDHSTFRNTYLLPMDPNGPSVRIASGVALTNVVFEGTNAWVRGKYGLYWDDTESKGVSMNLSVRNVRVENGTAPGGEMIHIAHNYGLVNLILENIMGCSGGVGGVFLRKCNNATIENLVYTPVAVPEGFQPVALDIDESCGNVVLLNTFCNGGLVKTGKLVRAFATNRTPEKSDIRTLEVYDRPGNEQGEGLVIYGTNTWCHSGELAAGATLPLPVGSGLGTRVATVNVAATDGEAINESANFMVGGNGSVTRVAGTQRTSATPAEGRLCLVAGDRVELQNQLGVKVNVVVTVFWSRQ